MSRSTSPFLEISIGDNALVYEEPTTRVVYLSEGSDVDSSHVSIAEKTYYETLQRIQTERFTIQQELSVVDEEFRRVIAKSGDVATAPPVEIQTSEDTDQWEDTTTRQQSVDDTTGNGTEIILTALEADIERLSLTSFLAQDGLTSTLRNLVSVPGATQNANATLPSESDLMSFFERLPEQQKRRLQAEAVAAHPDYDPASDPRLRDMECSICCEIMTDPAAVFDQLYDYHCIRQWLQQQNFCPNTRNAVSLNDVRRNVRIKNFIETAISEGQSLVTSARQQFVKMSILPLYFEQFQQQSSQSVQDALVRLHEQLETAKTANREQQEAAKRKLLHQHEVWKKKLDRQQAAFNKQQLIISRHRDQIAALENISNQVASSHGQYEGLQEVVNTLRKKEQALTTRLLELDEEEKICSGDYFREVERHRKALASQAARDLLKRVLLPPGCRCHRCGSVSEDLIASKMFRCFRCGRTFCHDCCRNVGAVVLSAVETRLLHSDDDFNHETIRLGNNSLTLCSWKRICGGCYNVCLRARGELETTGAEAHSICESGGTIQIVEDELPFFYVLKPSERETWKYATGPSAMPSGLVAEWRLVPDSVAHVVDTQLKAAHDEYLPAVGSAVRSTLEKLRERLSCWGVLSSDTADERQRLANRL